MCHTLLLLLISHLYSLGLELSAPLLVLLYLAALSRRGRRLSKYAPARLILRSPKYSSATLSWRTRRLSPSSSNLDLLKSLWSSKSSQQTLYIIRQTNNAVQRIPMAVQQQAAVVQEIPFQEKNRPNSGKQVDIAWLIV